MLNREPKIATGAFRWSLLCLSIGLLILVRGVEHMWFKDSFILLLEGAERSEYMSWIYHVKLPLRYFINSGLSLAILYVIFRDRRVVQLSAVLLGIAFLLLFPLYLWFIVDATTSDYMPVFYIRRLLAHPILLMLVLMGFYHESLNKQFDHTP